MGSEYSDVILGKEREKEGGEKYRGGCRHTFTLKNPNWMEDGAKHALQGQRSQRSRRRYSSRRKAFSTEKKNKKEG